MQQSAPEEFGAYIGIDWLIKHTSSACVTQIVRR
jgi:hypothetical protein